MDSRTSRETILGAGIFIKKKYDNTLIYYGIRSGLGKTSSRYNHSSQSMTFHLIGPTIGGEYHFGGHFSLGGEGQLLYETGQSHHYWRNSSYKNEELRLRVILRFLL